jgi:hypothetical protein
MFVLTTFARKTYEKGIPHFLLGNGSENVATTKNTLNNRPRKWRIKLNEYKSVHINFTNNKIRKKAIFIKETKFPYANTAKYLGMTLDSKLK